MLKIILFFHAFVCLKLIILTFEPGKYQQAINSSKY